MWRNGAWHSRFNSRNFHSLQCPCIFTGLSPEQIFPLKLIFSLLNASTFYSGCLIFRKTWTVDNGGGQLGFGFFRNDHSRIFSYLYANKRWLYSGYYGRGLTTIAEAVSSTTEEEDIHSVIDSKRLLKDKFIERDGKGETKKKQWVAHGKGSPKNQVLWGRQVKIEIEAWKKAVAEYEELLKEMCEHKLAPNLPYMKSLFLGWFEPLRDAISKEQELIKLRKCRATYAPYFDKLPADKMAVITMHKLVALLMTSVHGSALVVPVVCAIGDAIEQEIKVHDLLEKATKRNNEHQNKPSDCESDDDALAKQSKLREKASDLIHKQKLKTLRHILKSHDNSKAWSQGAKAKVGSRLIELCIQTAYIQSPINQSGDLPPDCRPAFSHATRSSSKGNMKICKTYGIVECDPQILKGLQKSARHTVIPYMPMLVPPLSWTGYNKGGHLFLQSHLMRIHGARQQREALMDTPRSQLQLVFEALNTLGRTKWRINKKVLSVVHTIWASGGRLARLPNQCDVPLPEKPDTEDEVLFRKWKWKVRNARKENSERHSMCCDTELKLAVACKMKDEAGFYYPHNLDFRGRAYPMHPHLNHLGSDMCRGILEFSEGRSLGKSGLHWLKIHLANVFAGGVDKLPFEGRVAFAENHIDAIFDSADKPLEGKRWWLNAEDPFQCLATCINIKEALGSHSPETYISHIPVHQDGSCNGLQHYAALGRDKLGACAVNLVAGEKPSDVYSGIATRVIDIMRMDAQRAPGSSPDVIYAKMLVDQVDRKLVKQTVMTSVYGVTYVGARDQIKKRLKEQGMIGDEIQIFRASCYAAKVTLIALQQMFEAARSIMSWLTDCAKMIASENESVRWTTPLGLPVVQPYCKRKSQLVRTSLQVLTLRQESGKVMVHRQRTAFPPNFVHSLDGSHMMMTAVACRKAGLNFAGVHDSYWTHACDVDTMNRIVRQKFVQLYEKPILENLLDSFQHCFPTVSFPALPERGEFDLNEVLRSPYFFN